MPRITRRSLGPTFHLILVASLAFMSGVRAKAATLDDFNSLRPKWIGTNLAIENGALRALSYTSATYDSVLGVNQSVSGIWKAVGGSEQDLLLKCQGSPGAHIEVRYDANTHLLRVAAYNLQWVDYVQWPWTVNPGDTVTAACDSLGWVGVMVNHTSIGTANVSSWPYATKGGRIGVTMGTLPRLDAIAVFGFSPPVPSPYVTWRWTWPATDSLGFPERGLKYGTMYQREDVAGSEWEPFFTLSASKKEGKPASVSLSKALVWGQLPRVRTRFAITATDSAGNESIMSNEITREP